MKKIVIIEDDRITLSTITKFLKKYDYSITTAQDGEEGLSLVRKEIPDLILLDVIMPVMNGFEVFAEIMSDENLKNIPILFLTNLDDIRRKKEVLEQGAVDYIVKSNIDLEDLKLKIDSLFAKAS